MWVESWDPFHWRYNLLVTVTIFHQGEYFQKKKGWSSIIFREKYQICFTNWNHASVDAVSVVTFRMLQDQVTLQLILHSLFHSHIDEKLSSVAYDATNFVHLDAIYHNQSYECHFLICRVHFEVLHQVKHLVKTLV